MEQIIPFKEILASPNTAWALLAIILVIYVMRDSGKREERLMGIIDGTLAEQTKTLANINVSLVSMQGAVYDVKARVEDIEDLIGIEIEKEEKRVG
ncbi:hypothetical protein KIAC18_003983 [Sporomusa sphaeroides]|uniref:hypothetical protein n=1 Tax=Sporomusa sphaeroides TaxID=47679 RepID=UPI003DA00B5E